MRAVSAKTKQPNTSETDLMTMVPHEVTLDNGWVVSLMAEDPLNAIAKVNNQLAVYGVYDGRIR